MWLHDNRSVIPHETELGACCEERKLKTALAEPGGRIALRGTRHRAMAVLRNENAFDDVGGGRHAATKYRSHGPSAS